MIGGDGKVEIDMSQGTHFEIDVCPGIDDLDPSPEPRTASPRFRRYEGSLLADCAAVQPAPKAESVLDTFTRIIGAKP